MDFSRWAAYLLFVQGTSLALLGIGLLGSRPLRERGGGFLLAACALTASAWALLGILPPIPGPSVPDLRMAMGACSLLLLFGAGGAGISRGMWWAAAGIVFILWSLAFTGLTVLPDRLGGDAAEWLLLAGMLPCAGLGMAGARRSLTRGRIAGSDWSLAALCVAMFCLQVSRVVPRPILQWIPAFQVLCVGILLTRWLRDSVVREADTVQGFVAPGIGALLRDWRRVALCTVLALLILGAFIMSAAEKAALAPHRRGLALRTATAAAALDPAAVYQLYRVFENAAPGLRDISERLSEQHPDIATVLGRLGNLSGSSSIWLLAAVRDGEAAVLLRAAGAEPPDRQQGGMHEEVRNAAILSLNEAMPHVGEVFADPESPGRGGSRLVAAAPVVVEPGGRGVALVTELDARIYETAAARGRARGILATLVLVLLGIGHARLTLGRRELGETNHHLKAEREKSRWAREALAQSEEMYRSVVERAEDGIAIVQDENIVYVNPQLLELAGVKARDVLGRPLRDFFSPEDGERLLDRYHRRLKGEAVERYHEATITTPDDRQFEVEINAGLSTYQGRAASMAIIRDVSERKRTEQALRESELRYRQLFDTVPLAVFLVEEENSRILDANTQASAMYGYGQDEFIGLPFTGMSVETDKTLRSLENIFEGARLTHPLRYHRRKDGTVFPVAVAGAGMKLGGRRVAVYVTRDISEEQRSREELRRSRDRADRASNMKSRFLAGFSHEIRTPLNTIIGISQLVAEGGTTWEEAGVRIMDAAAAMQRLVEDIRDLSRIETGNMEIAERPFSLDNLLESLRGAFVKEALRKELTIETRRDSDMPEWVTGDRRRLEQVLANLVGNAVKYTERGGVKIEVAPGENPGSGESGLRLEAVFSVSDTGPGIDPEVADKMFEPFFTTGGEGSSGTGLGLSIARELAGRMNGDLEAVPRKEGGSLFLLRLPLLSASEAQDAPRERNVEDCAVNGDGLTILLVEDNLLNRDLGVLYLTKLGHTTLTAESGLEALRMLARQRVDVVLMDIQMPHMSGEETARKIRSAEAEILDPQVPIVALTAHAMKGDSERFLAAGMDGYMAKPVSFRKLDEMLRDLVGRRRRGEPEREPFVEAPETREKSGPEESDSVLNEPAAMARIGNDVAILDRALTMFADQAEKQETDLRAYVDSGELDAVSAIAHTLAGTAASVGAERVTRAARNLERAALTDQQAVSGSMRRLSRELDACLERIAQRAREVGG